MRCLGHERRACSTEACWRIARVTFDLPSAASNSPIRCSRSSYDDVGSATARATLAALTQTATMNVSVCSPNLRLRETKSPERKSFEGAVQDFHHAFRRGEPDKCAEAR